MKTRKLCLGMGIALAFVLSACRVRIDVPDGGHVNVAEAYACLRNSHCVERVNSVDYSASYEAVPRAGYVFVEWASGERHLFGGETNATVELNASTASDNALLEKLLESDETFYIRPIFALRDYDTQPIGVPSLLRVDCEDCAAPMSLDWSEPVITEAEIGVLGPGWTKDDEFVLATYMMYAKDYDYKIENLSAHINNIGDIARFEGISEGQILRKGSYVVFQLMTQVPDAVLGLRWVKINYSFDIAGKDVSFDATLDVYIGDTCPYC